MLFWSVGGVLLTNAYKVYLRVNEDGGIRSVSEGLLTLYEFSRKPIATMYWINPAATVSQWSGKGSSKILFSKSPDTLSTITGNASINRVAGALRDSSAQLGLQIAEMLQHLL